MRHSAFIILASLLLASPVAGIAQTAPDQAAGGNSFTGRDAQAILAEALARSGAGEDVKVTIQGTREDDILAQSAGIISAEADEVQMDKDHSRWQASLLLKTDGRNLAPIKLSGHYDTLSAIPVLSHTVQAGETITDADIAWDKEMASHLHRNIVTDTHELVGKSARHTISQNRPIRLDEVASPTIISRGAQVTIFYRSANIEIKTFGEAMENGGKGDVIKIRNTTSKSVIQGIVESADRVRVTVPTTDAAEAM